jgi:hypothetical protein
MSTSLDRGVRRLWIGLAVDRASFRLLPRRIVMLVRKISEEFGHGGHRSGGGIQDWRGGGHGMYVQFFLGVGRRSRWLSILFPFDLSLSHLCFIFITVLCVLLVLFEFWLQAMETKKRKKGRDPGKFHFIKASFFI